jgi:beta-N-acetylhexosaminidase
LIATTLDAMTIEDKVGQLIMTYFNGEEANHLAEKLIIEARIGGIIYYDLTNGLKNPEQVKNLSAGLQKLAKENQLPPLFIAIDQEGGRVARLKEGFTQFPSSEAIGKSGNVELAFEQGKRMSKELLDVGINMNFAPVVDVNSNPDNPVIGSRAFGSDPKVVAAFGLAAVRGYIKGGVLPVIKHFPGYGEVSADPHYSLPTVYKTKEELDRVELYPFGVISKETPVIMTAHMMLPLIDPNSPATLSVKIIGQILREEMEYDGLVVTDSLVMNAIYGDGRDIIDVSIRAFLAGHDILLFGGREFSGARDMTAEDHVAEIIRIHHGLVEAVKSGIISEERIDQSLERIRRYK